MVEVFQTTINNQQQSEAIAQAIRREFPDYHVNFDLEDCDKILRVAHEKSQIVAQKLIQIVESFGVEAAVLPD